MSFNQPWLNFASNLASRRQSTICGSQHFSCLKTLSPRPDGSVSLQNDHDELWNILDFAVPGSLGDKNQFKDFYAVPMKKAQQASANPATIDKVCQNPDMSGFLTSLDFQAQNWPL